MTRDFQTGSFGDVEQLKIDNHSDDFGQVKIDHNCSFLPTLGMLQLFY